MFLEGKTLELMLAAIVALVVVGPKDLPVLLRRFGQFMAKLRGMAAEFRASFDEMARQSELDELRKEVDALRRGHLAELAGASPTSEINQAAADIHQSLAEVGVELHGAPSYEYAPTPAEPTPEPPPLSIAAAEPKPKAKPRAKAAAGKTAPAKKTTAPKKAATKSAAKPRAKAAKP